MGNYGARDAENKVGEKLKLNISVFDGERSQDELALSELVVESIGPLPDILQQYFGSSKQRNRHEVATIIQDWESATQD